MQDSTQGQEHGLILPGGVRSGFGDHLASEGQADSVMVVNETGLPDRVVEEAVMDTFVENASLAWARQSTFQTYTQQGNMLARSAYRAPANIRDEIKLARELAEWDDDVAAVIGQMIALAFGEGMENHHRDEKTVAIFNEVARNADLDLALQELYRELLISSQINIATLYTREEFEYTLGRNGTTQSQSVTAPLIGVLPAEHIRILGNDMFRTGILAYDPEDGKLSTWLDKFFNPETSAAEKAAMGREDRVSANLFTGVVEISAVDQLDTHELPASGGRLYTLNTRLVDRTTFPKGAGKYPHPLLTRNFGLLEAKRLLNIMDYALLQGGSNYIVVAKKGTDQHPAQAGEVTNLSEVVRRASKTGVIVGDHRLDFQVITPELKELLNPEKRRMLGRKLVMAMMRLTEHGEEEGGSEGIKSDSDMAARVVTSDRQMIKRLVERHVYRDVAKRNRKALSKGPAELWFPKIILGGTQWFTDYVLKLRDRGDIPRSWAVAAGGFDWEAAVEGRKRELQNGDDDIMQPGSVPHSSPESGPQDNNTGRPKGAGDGSRPDPAAPRPRIIQTPGETIKGWFEESVGQVVRMGESTYALLEEHPDRRIGRVTDTEREAMEAGEVVQRGQTLHVPVNPAYPTKDHKAVRLRDGFSMVVGTRTDTGAVVARLLSFREPDFSKTEAEDLAMRWGFYSGVIEQPSLPPPADS